MLKHLTTVLVLLATTTPALPLSCAYLDATAMYQQAADASARYVVVRGAFLRNGPNMPLASDPVDEGMGMPYAVDMLFYGDLGSRVGFQTPVELELRVEVSCVLSWCGALPEDGHEVLAFLRVDEDRNYYLSSGPCPAWVIHSPSLQDLDQISACMRGEDCDPVN